MDSTTLAPRSPLPARLWPYTLALRHKRAGARVGGQDGPGPPPEGRAQASGTKRVKTPSPNHGAGSQAWRDAGVVVYESGPVFEALLEWCDQQLPLAEKHTPIRAALYYVTNNRQDLGRFLLNGKVPIHNNRSELELRRLVIGRANWLLVGSDDSAPWTCTFSSLVASCAMNGLDPASYLRDLFQVLPHWPARRLLELCPRDWKVTRARLDAAELDLPLGPLTVPAPPG